MADQVNLVYLSIWMAIIALGMFNFGYGVGMYNNFTEIVFKQYEHYGKNVIDNISTFDSIVTTAFPVGAAFGSFTGGMIAALGRRNGLLITNVIVCVGTGITMIFNFYALIIGRIIFGFGCGVYTVIVPLFISESSPPSVAGVMGAISQFNVTGGIMIAYLLGYLAPLRYTKKGKEETNPEVFTTNAWRYVFIFPAGVAIIQSLLILLVFRYDTPKYYRQNGKDELEQKVYQAIYKSRDSEINKSVNESPQSREQTVPVKDLWGDKYRTAFIVGCVLALVQQLSGINAVIFYSKNIFTQGRSPGYDTATAARTGTVIVGVVNWASTMMAIPLLSKFGRKKLLLGGQAAMIVTFIILAVLAIIKVPVGIIVFTLVFVAFFEFSIGPILWLYCAEVMTENGMAAASLITWLCTIFFGIATQNIFDLLKPYGVYFTFWGVCVAGFIFIFFVVKETKGLSKEALKVLYSDRRYNQLSHDEDNDIDQHLKTSDL